MSLQLALAGYADMQQLRTWFNSADEQYSWGGDNFSYPCSEIRFFEMLCRPGTQSFSLLDEQEQLIGFGQICDRFGCHHLARLAINPSQRGKGLSKVLVHELIIFALQQDIRPISLYVHRHNTIAISCYKALGFRIGPAPEVKNERLFFMTLAAEDAISRANRYLTSA